ncbi:unnamed protein product [uncultured bacterium]|nr:unnamed protein product [uncultured bacterium]
MRVSLVTTDTTHHLYFAWRLAERFGLSGILLETRRPSFPFATDHPFEAERDAYEREVLLAGCSGSYRDFAETWTVRSANDVDAHDALRGCRADVAIALGPGRLGPSVLALSPVALNLHGGNPEQYRGLDSHLWAIYHRDFANLVVALHHVTPVLDAGDIVFETQLRPPAGSELYQLRSLTIQAAVDLAALALDRLERGTTLPARSQVSVGRYYSAMPAVLKDGCVAAYRAHVNAG